MAQTPPPIPCRPLREEIAAFFGETPGTKVVSIFAAGVVFFVLGLYLKVPEEVLTIGLPVGIGPHFWKAWDEWRMTHRSYRERRERRERFYAQKNARAYERGRQAGLTTRRFLRRIVG